MIRVSSTQQVLLVLFLLSSLGLYFSDFSDEAPTRIFLISSFSVMVFISIIIITVIGYASDGPDLEFKLPHLYIADYFKEKKQEKEKKAKLYDALYHAKTKEEIDLINKKLEHLEN